MKRITISALALLFAIFTVDAQMVTVLTDGDAALSGIAGAAVASSATAFAPENNPAAMSMFDGKMAAGVSYNLYQPSSVRSNTLSAAGFYRLSEKISAGLVFKTLSYDSYDVTSSEGRSNSTFKPGEVVIALGASYLIMDGLSAGVNAKYANMKLSGDLSVSAFMFDIAARYERGSLAAGINARNIGSDYFNMRAGAAYTLSSVAAFLQADYIANIGVMGSLGAQYSFKDMVFVRAGLHLGAKNQIPTYLSLGVGAKFAGIGIDLSCLMLSPTLKNSLCLGLSYSF